MYESKRNIVKYLAFLPFLSFIVIFSSVYAADPSYPFTSQTATSSGSSWSEISTNSSLSYVNKWNNSSVVGNYFTGTYYDSMLWFFTTDWSSNELENVRVVGSTNACDDSYGYKIGGYAFSTYFWFIDFDYDDSIFVYYCLDDGMLHGYWYNGDLGFQSFEWIVFDILADPDTNPEDPDESDAFVNEGSNITNEEGTRTVWPDIIEFEATQESLFYIIK